jgi:hypothetical protein
VIEKLWQNEPKLISRFMALALLMGICSAVQAQQKPEESAERSADAWLALIDSGKSADSWQEGVATFQGCGHEGGVEE